MDDYELLAELKKHNELIFDKYLDKHFNLFYSIAAKIISPIASHEDIIDCLLEAFSYIWFHIYLYNPEKCSFRAWCSLIIISRAQNKYTSIQRYNNKKEQLQTHQRTQISFAPSAEETYFKQQIYLDIREKITLLPQPTQDIFIQRYISGIKPQQIAPCFNMTAKEVDRHLRKAKKILRKGLQENEFK